jgi:hypothetical protein
MTTEYPFYSRLARVFAVAFFMAITAATAGDLDVFTAALDDATLHNRAALRYLRAERTDLAVMELQRMREAFSTLVERFGKERPEALRDDPDYVTTIVDVPTRIVATFMMIDFGRIDIAEDSLVSICRSLSELRRAARGEQSTDCSPRP